VAGKNAATLRVTPSTESGGILRRNLKFVVGLFALMASGILAGVFLPAGHATTTTHHASKATINVTENEWSIKLSKRSIPVGTTVAFKVTNKGKIGHDFR